MALCMYIVIMWLGDASSCTAWAVQQMVFQGAVWDACKPTTGLAQGWNWPSTVGGSVGASGTLAVAVLDDVLQFAATSVWRNPKNVHMQCLRRVMEEVKSARETQMTCATPSQCACVCSMRG